MESLGVVDSTFLSRERLAAAFTFAARLSFAGVLFTSPWMIQWVDVQRRLDSIYSGYTDFFIYPSDLFLLLTVVFGLATPPVEGRRWQRGPWYLTFPLLGLVALSFLSALFALDPPLSLYHSLRFVLLFGLYLALVNTRVPPGWVAAPLALAVLVQSVVAILQFATQASLGLHAWGELVLDPAVSGVSILRYDDVRILRAYGLTEHPNLLGGFLAFALIFVIGYYLASGRRARSLMLVPVGLGVAALFYTFSRSAQLALAVGAALMAAALLRAPLLRRRRLGDAVLLVIVILLAVLVPAVNNQRLLAQRLGASNAFQENVNEARSVNERDALIQSANRVFYQRQALGVGNGGVTLGMYVLDPEFPRDTYFYQPAHLVLLDAAAELGLVGGFLWLWLMVAPLIAMWHSRAQLTAHPWLAAVSAAILFALVAGFFDYYTWFWQPGRIWQWSAWGLFASAVSRVVAPTAAES